MKTILDKQDNPLKDFEIDGIDGIIKYRQYILPFGQNPQDLPIEFLLRDALDYSENVIYIDLIKINSTHRQGFGSILLQAFIKEHSSEFIILNAGAIDENEYNNDLDYVLNKLTKFYEKNNFININHIIGFCCESIVFGYNNSNLREKLKLNT